MVVNNQLLVILVCRLRVAIASTVAQVPPRRMARTLGQFFSWALRLLV
jgi:hypothetical protein